MQEAYRAYKQARKGLIYAAQRFKEYKKVKDLETVNVTTDQIVAEIRQNPNLETVARIIEDPLAHALMTMLITYEKYNYETDEQGVQKTINQAHDFTDAEGIFGENDEPYNEIEMMKELVLEFGDAISERMRDIDRNLLMGNNKNRTSGNRFAQKSDADSLHEVALKGDNLRVHAKGEKYLMINKMIVEHPEFEFVKNKAKQKVLERVLAYKEKVSESLTHGTPAVLAQSPTPETRKRNLTQPSLLGKEANFIGNVIQGVGNIIKQESSPSPMRRRALTIQGMLDADSPIMRKQAEINKPRRRASIQRSRLQFLQFVQSDVFLDTFTGLMQSLDTHHGNRRHQTKHASNFINKQAFYKLAKEAVTQNLAPNPNINFVKACYDQKVIPFPIFSKVQNNTLCLDFYHLNEGYSIAMQKFFSSQKAYEALIDSLILHGNNLNDKDFCAILQGIKQQRRLRHLHYGLNELGEKANEALLHLLEVPFPRQLRTLVLVNLKLTATAGKQQQVANPYETFDPADQPNSDEEAEPGEVEVKKCFKVSVPL